MKKTINGIELEIGPEANLARAYLVEANLAWVNLARADLTWANLTEAYLTGADLTGAHLPSVTMLLSACWGELSPGLTADLMNYDASCLPDPERMAIWAKGDGPCPFEGMPQRPANFHEDREWWDPERPPCTPWNLLLRCFAEKEVKHDWMEQKS